MYLPTKKEDEKLGANGEDKVLDYFTKKGLNIKKIVNKWSIVDYNVYDDEGEIIGVYELKTRRISSKKYDTVFFGKNKLNKMLPLLDKGIDCKIYFLCSDGLYYWNVSNNTEEYEIDKVWITTRKKYNELVKVSNKYLTLECADLKSGE